MKNSKKLISTLLALVMVLGCLTTAVPFMAFADAEPTVTYNGDQVAAAQHIGIESEYDADVYLVTLPYGAEFTSYSSAETVYAYYSNAGDLLTLPEEADYYVDADFSLEMLGSEIALDDGAILPNENVKGFVMWDTDMETYVSFVIVQISTAEAADSATFSVSLDDCTLIGEDEDMEAPIYLIEAALTDTVTGVEFVDFADCMSEYGTITSLYYDYVEGTNIAPISPAYKITDAGTDSWVLEDEYEDYDLIGCYGYFIMTDDMDYFYVVLKNTAAAPVEPVATPDPVVSVNGLTLKPVSVEEDAYSYTDWSSTTTTGPLYTYVIPFGTTEVAVNFGRNVIAYNYKGTNNTDDDYISGWFSDYTTGESSGTFGIDANKDGALDTIQVQTPYDAAWNTSVLYGIAFRYPSDPVISVDGLTLKPASVEADAYSYTDWQSNTTTAPLYTYVIPFGTTEVSVDFGSNVLAYNYKGTSNTDSDYISGWFSDFMTGDSTGIFGVDANSDGALDTVQVQVPYDSAWNTAVLYGIAFQYPAVPVVTVNGVEAELVSTEEDAYSYTDWQSNTSTGKLFTFVIPDGTENVTVDFGSNVLAYNYKGTSNTDTDYVSGYYEDFMTGESTRTFLLDSDNDGAIETLQVQVPYDDMWNTKLLYGIAFRFDTVQITAQPQSVETAKGVSATFTVEAENAASYQWYYSTNGTKWYKSSAASATTASLTMAGTSTNNGRSFRCVITGTNGKTVTSEVATLTVNMPKVLTITAQPEDASVAKGASATFTVEAENAVSYQWYYSTNGTKWYKSSAASATTASLTVAGTTTNDGRSYRCVVTGEDGKTVTTDVVTLTLKVLAITAQPEDTETAKGTPVTFTVEAQNAVSYQWYYTSNGTKWYKSSASGAATASLTVAGTTTNNGRSYRCVITGEDGKTVTSDAAALTVH